MTPNLDHKPVTFREFLACALRIVGWHADTKDSVPRRTKAPGWYLLCTLLFRWNQRLWPLQMGECCILGLSI
jgi:hypothetical protein